LLSVVLQSRTASIASETGKTIAVGLSIFSPGDGVPIGLLLSLTYSSFSGSTNIFFFRVATVEEQGRAADTITQDRSATVARETRTIAL
jgi:hypothetical protein